MVELALIAIAAGILLQIADDPQPIKSTREIKRAAKRNNQSKFFKR